MMVARQRHCMPNDVACGKRCCAIAQMKLHYVQTMFCFAKIAGGTPSPVPLRSDLSAVGR